MRHLLIITFLLAIGSSAMAQRHTDQLDRGLVAIPTGASGNSSSNLITWRRLTNEQYGVTYNVYKDGTMVASEINATSYSDDKKAPATTQYQVAAVVNGVEQEKCATVTPWTQYVYKYSVRCPTGVLDIQLATVYDRDGNDVTEHYSPNDAELADLDGDGQLEIIIKRLNTVDASPIGSPTGEYQKDDDGNEVLDDEGNKIPLYEGGLHSANSKEFVVIDAYDVNWQTGEATLMWRIDCGPNMVSMNSTEIDVIAYDWDEDGKAEVVLRGADNMIIHKSDNTTQTVGIADFNFRKSSHFGHSSAQYSWSHFGKEYLIYMNGETGNPYQIIDFPLPRLEESEWAKLGVSNVAYNDYVALEAAGYGKYFNVNGKKKTGVLYDAWGDNYGHRSTKFFFGAPVLDGRKASLFLGRGIYTRHKMIAMDLDRGSHQWKERWRWACNDKSSPWYGNGYHNYVVADVDEDGRDEIVYGSMVIDDNGRGLHTTGYGHGDAQHVGDFDPWRKGLEFFGCLEEKPDYGSNYRNATTGEIYWKHTSTSDDGRALMGNFSNDYPGSLGRSVSSNIISSVTDNLIESLSGDSFIPWGKLNQRIYWDGDLCSEILDSPGTAKEASIDKPGTGRLFTSSGCNMNNSSKNNPCFQGDIIGDWREEIIVRYGTNIRVYTSGMGTAYSFPTLWNDHQYRQAMAWQMMAYNQPPHLSYFLGEMEGITTAPPTLTLDGRTEIANGGTITSTNTTPVILCETGDMTVSVAVGASPEAVYVNAPTWVQGNDDNNAIATTTYTHTLTGAAFTGATRLVKQGDGVLQLPKVIETYTGATDVWAGTLRFDGTLQSSPLWLNRFTRLETTDGTFAGGIKADYAATIVPTSSINTTTLTLGFGSRIILNVYADHADQLNAEKLTIERKTGEAWENYGPEYLQPVIQLVVHETLPEGFYNLGTISTLAEDCSLDDIKVEGFEEGKLRLHGNLLQLVVGNPKDHTVTCPEATITEVGTTTAGLPVVSVAATPFEAAPGVTVTPTLSAIFTNAQGQASDVSLTRTLYTEDYEHATDASDWTTKYATIEFVTGDETQGNYTKIAQGGGSGPRSAYKVFYSKDNDFYDIFSSYTVEFDAQLHYTNGAYAPNAIILFGEGAKMPSSNAVYTGTNYLFKLSGGQNYSRTYTVEGDSKSYELTDASWYHYTVKVDKQSRTVTYTISESNNVIGSGTYSISDESISLNNQGIEVELGRAYSYAGIDNISITTGDYVFTEQGTLTVTSSYEGCESSTATFTYPSVTMGDVNADGTVNIVDVTMTISHILGQNPEGFNAAAADVSGDGTVNIVDVTSIIDMILKAK